MVDKSTAGEPDQFIYPAPLHVRQNETKNSSIRLVQSGHQLRMRRLGFARLRAANLLVGTM